MNTLERRRFVRVPFELESSYQAAEGDVAPQTALGQDLSLGGMRLRQKEKLELGRKIQVSFSLPEEGRVMLTGIVVWCRPSEGAHDSSFEAGLRWEGVHPLPQARLNSFLAQRTHPLSPIAPPIISVESPIHWGQAIGLSLAASLVFIAAAYFFLERSRLNSEAVSLRAANQFHETQMNKLIGRMEQTSQTQTDSSTTTR